MTTTEKTALEVYAEYVGGNEMPEECREDFDEAYARDLFISDYFSAPNPEGPGIFVFRNL